MPQQVLGLNNAHHNIGRAFFTGSTAIKKGMGLCYDIAYGTATTATEAVKRRVAVPTVANRNWFAGVSRHDYVAKTGGQYVDIDMPGGVAEVAVGVDTTRYTGLITCTLSGESGRFMSGGFHGRGSAIPLATKTNVLEVDLSACAAALDATGLILTDSSATFVTAAVAAGDKVMIVAGEQDGTNHATTGLYTVASITSETVLVLTAAASDGGTMQVAYSCFSGNPTILCELLDGPESGLASWVSPHSAGAVTCPQSGFNRIFGAVTLATDSTGTLADGTFEGQRVAFLGMGTLTTNEYVITVTTGTQVGVVTALASITIDAAAEFASLVWTGQRWQTIAMQGATPA